MRRRLAAALVSLTTLAACSKAISGDHPVTSANEAIAQAQAALIGTPQAAGPFKVVRAGGTWNVSAPPSATGAVTVYVSAKTGRAVVYTDEGAKAAGR